MRFQAMVFLFCFLAFPACSYRKNREQEGSTPVQQAGAGPVEPTFASIRERVFARKCVLCHNPGGRAREVPLDSVADLTRSAHSLVVPGRPEESHLYEVLVPGAQRPMPPPLSGIPPLSTAELAAIRDWITRGARD